MSQGAEKSYHALDVMDLHLKKRGFLRWTEFFGRHSPRPDWQELYVSGYAGAHPWEDFAETWAHYLHIVDTLETADAFGLRIHPKVGRKPMLEMAIDFDPYRQGDFDALVSAWLPFTYAVNSLNHSMGQPDLYPFGPGAEGHGEAALRARPHPQG